MKNFIVKITPYIFVVSFIWMFWILSYVYHVVEIPADVWWKGPFLATLGAVYACSAFVSGMSLAALLGRLRDM